MMFSTFTAAFHSSQFRSCEYLSLNSTTAAVYTTKKGYFCIGDVTFFHLAQNSS